MELLFHPLRQNEIPLLKHGKGTEFQIMMSSLAYQTCHEINSKDNHIFFLDHTYEVDYAKNSMKQISNM